LIKGLIRKLRQPLYDIVLLTPHDDGSTFIRRFDHNVVTAVKRLEGFVLFPGQIEVVKWLVLEEGYIMEGCLDVVVKAGGSSSWWGPVVAVRGEYGETVRGSGITKINGKIHKTIWCISLSGDRRRRRRKGRCHRQMGSPDRKLNMAHVCWSKRKTVWREFLTRTDSAYE
jgi:hypothetical protein